MDADGTLHNLRPIGRLEVSGADPEPPRIGDTDFGGKWFSSVPEEPAAETAGRERDDTKTVVVDMDITGLLNGVAITGDPSITVRSSSASPPVTKSGLDPAVVRAEVAERMTAVAPEDDADRPAEPVAVRPSLSRADLEAIRWRLDGGTLREVVDDKDALRELGERLDGPLADEEDNVAKAGLLSVRAEVYRLLGELGMAAAASRLALAHAESANDTQSMVIAQAELAHVLRLRGDHKEADRLFAKALGAAVPDTLRGVVHENAGRSCFDQGRHMEALDHFARAVRLGKADDTDLAERVGVCLEAVYIHVLRDGWGPYPRETADILGPAKPKPEPEPAGALDEPTAERPVVG